MRWNRIFVLDEEALNPPSNTEKARYYTFISKSDLFVKDGLIYMFNLSAY